MDLPNLNRKLAATCTALALSLAQAVCADPPERGFADPILGRWDLSMQGPDGPYPSWLEIRLRTERQLMGSFVGRFGSMRHLGEVSFSDGRLEFRLPVQYERDADELVFEATIEDHRLTGTMRAAESVATNWIGVPAPSLQRGAPPDWGQPTTLIEGDSLAGWHPRSKDKPGCWSVVDGILAATPPCVDLISDRVFDDFMLHIEFRYPQGSNSGIYLRGRYEVQIQDDHGKALDPLRLGGVYGFIAPETDAARPSGQWQTMVITLLGRRVTVMLNGTEIIAGREIPGITGGALDSNEQAPGPIMLQGDHGPVQYRNIVLTQAR
jgi:hypothetical protein